MDGAQTRVLVCPGGSGLMGDLGGRGGEGEDESDVRQISASSPSARACSGPYRWDVRVAKGPAERSWAARQMIRSGVDYQTQGQRLPCPGGGHDDDDN